MKAGYEKPIALLLADSFQALLVTDQEQCIQWRQRLNKNEQCVFAPLAAPRLSQTPESEELPPTSAHHFVSADGTGAELLCALLEKAHVATDLAAAWELKACHPLATVVTAQGELISRSGLLSVGQDSGAALAVLGRQAELRQLDADITKSSENLKQIQAQVEQAQSAVREKQAEVEHNKAATQELEIALSALRQEERTSRSSLEQLTRQKDQTGREVARLSAQENEGRERAERLEAVMAQTKELVAGLAEKLQKAQELVAGLVLQEQEQNGAVMTAKLELSSQTHQCEAWQQQREPVARRLQEFTELNKRRSRELQEHRERIQKAQEEIRRVR